MATQDADIARGVRSSLVGLGLNVVLVAAKLAAGVLGHSVALVADAIESTLDIFASVVVWRGLRIAGRPADADHPYGHGRAESLAGMIVAMTILAAGVGIALEAGRGLLSPRPTPAPFTLAVLLGVVVIKEVAFRLVRRVGRQITSQAVVADAWHHRSDAATSGAAAVGITVALIGGQRYAQADNWAALAGAAVIVLNALRLMRGPLRELMDTRPREVVDQARAVAATVPGVWEVEKVLARKSGLKYLVDMHVEVQAEMTVEQAHGVAHDVKDAVRAAMPNVQDVLVHIEPHANGSRQPEAPAV